MIYFHFFLVLDIFWNLRVEENLVPGENIVTWLSTKLQQVALHFPPPRKVLGIVDWREGLREGDKKDGTPLT